MIGGVTFTGVFVVGCFTGVLGVFVVLPLLPIGSDGFNVTTALGVGFTTTVFAVDDVLPDATTFGEVLAVVFEFVFDAESSVALTLVFVVAFVAFEDVFAIDVAAVVFFGVTAGTGVAADDGVLATADAGASISDEVVSVESAAMTSSPVRSDAPDTVVLRGALSVWTGRA